MSERNYNERRSRENEFKNKKKRIFILTNYKSKRDPEKKTLKRKKLKKNKIKLKGQLQLVSQEQVKIQESPNIHETTKEPKDNKVFHNMKR